MSNVSFEKIPGFDWLTDVLRSTYDPCYRCEQSLSLYLDDQLSPKQTAAVKMHLQGCEQCKASLVIMQATHQVLSQRQPVQPPAYLSERLRQAIALEATRPSFNKERRAPNAYRPRLAVAGFAVALIVGAAVFEVNHRVQLPVATLPSVNTTKVETALATPSPKSDANSSVERHRTTENHATNPNLVASIPIEPIYSAPTVAPFSQSVSHNVSTAPKMALRPGSSIREYHVSPVRELVASRPVGIAAQKTLSQENQEIAANVGGTQVPPVQTPSTSVDSGTGGGEVVAPPVQNADDTDNQAPHVSLVDEEMQSLAIAVNNQNQQPKLVRLAIAQTRLSADSGGLVPIVGTNIH